MFKEYDGTYVLNDINLDIKDKNVISIIGNSGGGQQQRLAIVRALSYKLEMMFFDEAHSSVRSKPYK